MSATGLDVFDKTLQTTNIWLNEIMDEMGPDRRRAWHMLGAVLHALRDRLQPELAVKLGAQLPILVRGVYYDGYKPSETPDIIRTLDEFLERVNAELEGTRPIDPEDAVRVVCNVVARHVDDGQARKIWKALPEDIRKVAAPLQRGGDGPDRAEARSRDTSPPRDLSQDARQLARRADDIWRKIVKEGTYGEAHSDAEMDAGADEGGHTQASRSH
jgi:uncharacterized protein (DUF2267 family)